MLDAAEVARAYQRYLGRDPESEAVVEALLGVLADRHELADHLRFSDEYRRLHPEEDSPLPLPPEALRRRVTGTEDVSWFLQSGSRALRSLEVALARFGHVLDGMRILDFGCGPGRLLRHLLEREDLSLLGADHHAPSRDWCRGQLPGVTLLPCGLEPPLELEAGAVDLVVALSVFTHLPAAAQVPWLAELTRVLRRGGLLALSLHGTLPAGLATPPRAAAFARGELVVVGEAYAGENACVACHPEARLRAWAEDLDLTWLERRPGGARGNPPQDLVLLQKR